MSKEVKSIVFVLITMIFNILAPILVVKTVKTYTAKSYIHGSPDNTVVISEFVKKKDYLYQENLSNLTLNEEDEYYVATYNFEERAFDLTKKYNIFINDYMCVDVETTGKSISGYRELTFKDINKEVLNTTKVEINFEFYNTYSSILIKVKTDDIQYFNGYKKNPGLIVTLAETNFNEEALKDICTVEFKSGDSVVAIKYIERFNSISDLPTAPTKVGYTFKGWSLDLQTVIDPLTLKILDNMVFNAIFEKE